MRNILIYLLITLTTPLQYFEFSAVFRQRWLGDFPVHGLAVLQMEISFWRPRLHRLGRVSLANVISPFTIDF
jgi:hypothetical protein